MQAYFSMKIDKTINNIVKLIGKSYIENVKMGKATLSHCCTHAILCRGNILTLPLNSQDVMEEYNYYTLILVLILNSLELSQHTYVH